MQSISVSCSCKGGASTIDLSAIAPTQHLPQVSIRMPVKQLIKAAYLGRNSVSVVPVRGRYNRFLLTVIRKVKGSNLGEQIEILNKLAFQK